MGVSHSTRGLGSGPRPDPCATVLRMRAVLLSLFVGLMVSLGASKAFAQAFRGPTRVNFDERLIKGQTTKAGSVYIFDRQESEIRSLVNRKRAFRYKIIRTVFEE